MSNGKQSGPVIAVTGAGGGVGRAVVREFDQRARPRSVQVFAAEHHGALLGAAATATAGLLAAVRRKAGKS